MIPVSWSAPAWLEYIATCNMQHDDPGRIPMKTLFAAALLAVSAAGFSAASAMPVAPASGASADVIQIAGGCGRGFHRDSFGRCRVNRGGVVVVRPRVVRPRVVRTCRYWGPGRVCRTWW